MNKWNKKLAAVLFSVAVAAGSLLSLNVTVQAAGYQRWDTVAEEERIQAAYTDSDKDNSKDKEEPPKKIHPRAWKKINGVCYNGSGEPIPGAITRGMDVSEWQGKINWKKVKNSDIDFALVRISHGTKKIDNRFEYNMRQAELAGIPVGTYVYSTATRTKEALAEAHLAIEKMKGYKVSYPVVYDLEYSEMGKQSKKQVARLALTFCNEVRKAGYYPMVYCNTNWYDYKIDWKSLAGYDVWLARYGDTIQAPPKDHYNYTIWQSTDGDGGGRLNPTRGLVAGVPKDCNVDMDFGYVDYTEKIMPRWQPRSDYVPSKEADISYDGNPYPGKTGWATENGKIYYYINDEKITGWKTIGGKTYFFHTKKNYMYKNKRTINSKGDIYYFGSDGARYEDGFHEIKINGKTETFYFKKDGKAHKGWLSLNGKKYYFYNGTAPLSGTRAENITLTSSTGTVSVFDENGVCVKQYKKEK